MADIFQQYELDTTEKPQSNITPVSGGSVLERGFLRSPNYAKGVSGWSIDAEGNAEFRSVTIAGLALQTIGTFGGDGSDGELKVESGTTTIDLGGSAVVVLNYSKIAITGTGKVAFSNPHANGTVLLLKSQGNIDITSSAAAPVLDFRGLGAAAGAASNGGGGNDGHDGTDIDVEGLDTNTHLGAKGINADGTAAGGAGGTAIGTPLSAFLITSANQLYHRGIWVKPGAGGGSGGDGSGSSSGGGSTVVIAASGAGGRGGGGIYIECGGFWNFTVANGISVAGSNGATPSNASGTGTGYRGGGSGGGGGGAGGMLVVLYKSLTANSGSVVTTGGNGGNGGNAAQGSAPPVGTSNGGGGGGGASLLSAGGAGGSGATPANGTAGSGTYGGSAGTKGANTANAKGGGGGGGGAEGKSLITQNKWFA